MADTRRIGVELPVTLIERIENQAAMLDCSRTHLIETALLGLVREFEEIDQEEGVPCTCGSPKAHWRQCAVVVAEQLAAILEPIHG